MGGIVIVTLLYLKIAFLIFVALMVGGALWELTHVLRSRQIILPAIPIAVGGAAMYALAYWQGALWAQGALGLTFILVLAWRLPAGADGYVRDVTSGIFALIYLWGMGSSCR